MKISTKGRYAVRILVDLAENQKGQYVSLKEVSARQGVSDKYSEQIMNLLNKAGIVKSTRGSKGGYMLNLAAEEITVGAVLRLAEGSLAPVPCLDGSCNTCERAKKCVTVEV
ncbi:MAG: Rrf2 family transcriptional regulator [Oscillospiraceae bacterium]